MEMTPERERERADGEREISNDTDEIPREQSGNSHVITLISIVIQ